MPAFFFAFLAVVLAGFGGRDQLVLAGLGARQGPRPAALLVAVGGSVLTAILAASAALAAQTQPATVRATVLMLVVVLAGIELLLARKTVQPGEPTNSLAALGIVLVAHQLTDAARLLVFAIALATQAPWAAGAGGAAGGIASMIFAWSLGDGLLRREIVWLRRGLGLAALCGALLFAFA